MREFRIIAGIVLVGLVVVIAYFAYSFISESQAGRLDSLAVHRIDELCGYQAFCKVRPRDLFPGEWDTFYEFGVGVSQDEIDAVLGPNAVKAADLQRTLVLTRAGRVVATEHENDGVERALSGEVEFLDEHHRENRWVKCDANTWLTVAKYKVDPSQGSGTYYTLTPDDPSIPKFQHP
jgi:hypothetical protein